MKKPHCKSLQRKNMTRPFEDQTSVEFLSSRNDTSLFVYGAHSKKRPHNLVLGRLFDFQLLDMIELGVKASTFKTYSAFSHRTTVIRQDSKPAMVFQGDGFDSDADLKTLQSVLLDFFRGEVLEKVNLAALDRVIVVTALENKEVLFRQYSVILKKSGTKFPRIELQEVGPHMDWKIRRVKPASEELMNQSLKVPKAATKQQAKNISTNAMGDRMGRVHLQRQDLSKLALTRMKGLRKPKKKKDAPQAQVTVDAMTGATATEPPKKKRRKKSSTRE